MLLEWYNRLYNFNSHSLLTEWLWGSTRQESVKFCPPVTAAIVQKLLNLALWLMKGMLAPLPVFKFCSLSHDNLGLFSLQCLHLTVSWTQWFIDWYIWWLLMRHWAGNWLKIFPPNTEMFQMNSSHESFD